MYEVNYSLLGVLATILAVIVAYVAWIRPRTTGTHQAAATPPPDKYADIRVSIGQGPHGSILTIRNLGDGSAKNINLHLEPLDHLQSPIPRSEMDEKIPIRVLAPFSECSLMLTDPDISTSTSFMVHIAWQHENGLSGSLESHMTTLTEL